MEDTILYVFYFRKTYKFQLNIQYLFRYRSELGEGTYRYRSSCLIVISQNVSNVFFKHSEILASVSVVMQNRMPNFAAILAFQYLVSQVQGLVYPDIGTTSLNRLRAEQLPRSNISLFTVILTVKKGFKWYLTIKVKSFRCLFNISCLLNCFQST